MPKYGYRAINAKGHPVRGIITAANETELFNRLQEGQMSLLDCKELNDRASKLAVLTSKKVDVRTLIQMFVHMEQLQKVGVPLLQSLEGVRDTTESPRLRDIIEDVHAEVSSGSSLSVALSKHPAVFEPIFIALINVGEEMGSLTNAFEQVIEHLKWTDAMNIKVKKATRYPKMLLVIILLVIGLMMNNVVPQVIGFLKDSGQVLPLVTQSLIDTSYFFSSYGIYILGVMALGYLVFTVGRAVSEEFRYRTDYLALQMPGMGTVIRKISLSRFCQTFSVLFVSGLEILKCIDSAKQTAGNLVIVEALDGVRQKVQEGLPLSAAMKVSGEFPPLVAGMIAIGEESGNLKDVLNQVSEFYDRDVNEAVDALVQMIEPALTVVLGGLLLWVAAAVFGPVYDMLGKVGV